MYTIPKPDHAKFLVERKFPELREPRSPLAKKYGFDDGMYDDETHSEASSETIEKAQEYHVKLLALPPGKIKEMYEQEFAKKNEEDDEKRFFNQKNANADLDHWSRMPYWSLDEAVAISFGKDPEVVFLGRMKSIMSYLSPFANSYRKLHEVVARGVSAGELTDPMKPSDFIAWAQRNNVPIPSHMAEIITSRAPDPSETNWKELYEELSKKNKTHIEDLQDKVDALSAALEESKADALDPRERKTIYKILLGALISGYGYDPSAKKNQAISDLANDIELLGLSVDQDTIRRWIKNALPLLPAEALEEPE